MAASSLLPILLLMLSDPTDPVLAEAEECEVVGRYGGPDGGPDLEGLARQARERCRPGQMVEVYAGRGLPLSPDIAAALLCQGGLFTEERLTGTPWRRACPYRGAAPVP